MKLQYLCLRIAAVSLVNVEQAFATQYMDKVGCKGKHQAILSPLRRACVFGCDIKVKKLLF